MKKFKKWFIKNELGAGLLMVFVSMLGLFYGSIYIVYQLILMMR